MALSTLGEVRNIRSGSYWRKAEFTPEVTDIARRLHEGDGTVGWLGDDTLTMDLVYEVDAKGNPIPGRPQMWEVRGRTAQGEEYICLKWPRCDASLLKALAERDVRTQSMLERFEREIMQQEKRREDARRERFEELADKAQWAIREDVGHLEGGTHRVTQVDGLKDKA